MSYFTYSRNGARFENDRVMGTNEFIEEEFNVAMNDITVFCGDNVRCNTVAAYRKALDLAHIPGFGKTLVINTSTTPRWALKEARAYNADLIGTNPEEHLVTVVSNVCGDVCNHFDHIKELIEGYGFKLLIINSWEFTSQTPRQKDKLLYQLRCLIEHYNISVIVYSDKTNAMPDDVGKTTRGALGKLSAVAAKITSVKFDESAMKSRRKNSESPIVKETPKEEIVEVKKQAAKIITPQPKPQEIALPWKEEYATTFAKEHQKEFVEEEDLVFA